MAKSSKTGAETATKPAPKSPGPEVNAKCRRGSDPMTAGSSCPSMRAYRTSSDGSAVVTLRCVKCSHVWSTPVGGSFNLL